MAEALYHYFGDKCWHQPEKPCPDFVDCLHHGPACADEAAREEYAKLLAAQRREDVAKPTIFVGMGTCGLGAGANKTVAAVKAYVDEKGLDVDLVEVGCIGMCSSEPILEVQLPEKARVAFAHVTGDKVPALLDEALDGIFEPKMVIGQHRQAGDGEAAWSDTPYLDEHEFFGGQTRWVLANCGIIDPTHIEEYVARGGYAAMAKVLKGMTPPEVCDVVEKSGLRGRGGGGFPTGTKWKFAMKAKGTQKYIVCNADEGDPGAFMDRAVVEGDVHRVLEGIVIAAYAIGASKAYIYIRAEYPLAIKRLKQAIAQAKDYGLLGHNMLDSGFNLEIVIKMGAGAFVCGEETALIHSIEGKRGMPRPRPPFPAVQGLFDKPTIINNVETMANLANIINNGADWFASVGTEGSKGTKVFALSGKVSRTGLVEVAMGTTMRRIVMDIGGGCPNDKKFKAVQIGGPSGGCIPDSQLDIEVDYESLKTVSAMMGSGGLVVMDEDNCMVNVAKFFMEFVQAESCGKCIPCREGTRRMLEILDSITRGRRSESGIQALERFKGVMHLEKLAGVIKDTSLCGLGQTAPNPVLSTLRWFRDEYEDHIFERHCAAGVCAELLTYTIDADACKGCTLCAAQCPAEAIMGNKKAPHYILQEKCIGCGSCVDVCRFNAIVAR
ncbi:MAG: NADH-quinone oxidoreductase subunit NuoF [Candidatus Lernaella stagnicola]|nr:NADH-quinone oxidoreductase subunit NuoF [Candidatus Lernaella stagnicola]